MSLSGALMKLDQATANAHRAATKFEERMNLSKADWERIGNIAAQSVKSDIIRYLLANYKNSGLVKRTGKLESAIRNSTVIFNWKGKEPQLKISMPAGISPYLRKNKDGSVAKSNFYEVAGSLNYGAVIMSKRERAVMDTSTGEVSTKRMSTVGAKAKKSIKKKLLGQKISKRSAKAIREGRKLKSGFVMTEGVNVGAKAKETERSISTAGGSEKVTVIKPFDFFELKEGQSKDIGEKFYQKVLELAKRKTGIQ